MRAAQPLPSPPLLCSPTLTARWRSQLPSACPAPTVPGQDQHLEIPRFLVLGGVNEASKQAISWADIYHHRPRTVPKLAAEPPSILPLQVIPPIPSLVHTLF